MPGDNQICAMRGCNNDRKFEPRKTTNYFSFWNKKSDSSRSVEYFIFEVREKRTITTDSPLITTSAIQKIMEKMRHFKITA